MDGDRRGMSMNAAPQAHERLVLPVPLSAHLWRSSCRGHQAPASDAWLPRVEPVLRVGESVLELEENPCLFPESLIGRLETGCMCTLGMGAQNRQHRPVGLGENPGDMDVDGCSA